MPFVILNRERFALPIGETRVGGTGDDALPFPELARAETAAILSLMPDGTATVRRAGDAAVLLNGKPLGPEEAPLTHGARIDVAGFRLVFGDLRDAGSTAHVRGISDDERALFATLAAAEPTADSGGRLTALATGTVYPISEAGLVIGRDPDCDVVIAAKNVSRRHASIRPSIQGYVVTDLGANGTYVNGRRVDAAQVLGMRDVIRVGDEQFRFEADAASFEPAPELRPAPSVAEPGAPVLRPTPVTPTAPSGPKLLATLEIITRGVLQGKRFRIERPVTNVGRAPHNDVHLDDDTVSGSHATLTRRKSGWVITDHGSTNGTYVEGERMAGERELPAGVSELRFGGVKMVFRPIAGGPDADATSTRAVVGVSLKPSRKTR
jgi:pSer/pThr/pTyr-binding forkhead associated (FHA) protein